MQVYWTKTFYYSGELIPFETKTYKLFDSLLGLSKFTSFYMVKKLELNAFFFEKELCSVLTEQQLIAINVFLSKTVSINKFPDELMKLNAIRYYLNRSYRGRRQVFARPVNGQRTRSNARGPINSFNWIREYIRKCEDTLLKTEPVKQFDYRKIKKLEMKKKNKYKKKIVKKKTNLWF